MKIEARVSNDDRNPIIQTFTLEDYNNKTKEEKLEIQEEISEKIEGDIPRVKLEEDRNKIRNKETSNKKIKLGEIHSDIREKADLESENLETGNLKIEEMIYSLQGQVYA